MSRLMTGVLVVALVTAGCGSKQPEGLFSSDDSGTAPDYLYIIPMGSGEAIDRGESLDILPAELTVTVGEVIEIINEDDRGHLVGPFFVGRGETLRQRFTDPGTFIGECTVHPSGQIILNVVK